MKSILLATAASVAFAGAAAAEVTFSGTAAVSYNNGADYVNAGTAVATGLQVEADLKASMSAELNNGLTATASVSVAGDNYGTATTHGSIALSSDTASITFGKGINGAAYTVVGDTYGVGLGKEATTGVVASYKLGETTLYVSAPVATGAKVDFNTVEIAATTSVQGWTISGAAAKVNGNNEVALKVSGAVAGATISAGYGSLDKGGKTNQWDVKASYPVGPVTVSAAYDEAQVYVLGASYAADGVTAAVEYTKGGAWSLDASYDYGSGIKVLAGLGDKGNDMYVGATYDLGGGASLVASYAKDADNSAKNEIGAPDYRKGTTVKVSFAF